MKRFIQCFIIALIPALLVSCGKDFLDKQPVSQALPTELSAEPLLTGAYDAMYDEYYTLDFQVNGDVMSDNCYAGGDNPANFQIDQFTVNSINGNVQRDWRYLYTDIKNANIVLNYVPTMKDPTLTEDRRQEILGEAAFLRAWHYFNLVNTWGAVPIITGVPNDVNEMFPSKKPVDSVYAQIIRDLEYALPKVRETVPNKGIVSKGAVNALLAKVYAQKPNPDWEKVVQYCDAVTALGYDLVTDYSSLFQTSGENSIESIWETQNDGVQHQNWITGMITPWMWGDWKKFNIPTHSLIQAFDEEGDVVRKNASVFFVKNLPWTDDYWKDSVPVIYKYPDPDGKSNTIRLRYADILLLKAEALVNLHQVNAAMDIVNNKIRARVHLAPKIAADEAAAKLIIENERRLELCFEGHRWYDLLRSGRAIEVMNSQTDGEGHSLNYNVTAAKLYFPIPQDEVDRNPNINK